MLNSCGLNAGIAALVALVLLQFMPPAVAQTAKDPKPSVGLQKEFDGFIAKFRTALKVNDSAAVTAMTRLPFFHGNAKIDAAQFRHKAYPAYFTASARSCIQRNKATYGRDGENNDNYFIFCGQRIFVFTKAPTGFLFAEVGVND